MRFALAAGTLSIVALAVIGSRGIAEEPGNPAGRFLFAGDDDWDWASPLGAEQPSKLVRYGAMGWSALDWAEADLEEVHDRAADEPERAADMERRLDAWLAEIDAVTAPSPQITHPAKQPVQLLGRLFLHARQDVRAGV